MTRTFYPNHGAPVHRNGPDPELVGLFPDYYRGVLSPDRTRLAPALRRPGPQPCNQVHRVEQQAESGFRLALRIGRMAHGMARRMIDAEINVLSAEVVKLRRAW